MRLTCICAILHNVYKKLYNAHSPIKLLNQRLEPRGCCWTANSPREEIVRLSLTMPYRPPTPFSAYGSSMYNNIGRPPRHPRGRKEIDYIVYSLAGCLPINMYTHIQPMVADRSSPTGWIGLRAYRRVRSRTAVPQGWLSASYEAPPSKVHPFTVYITTDLYPPSRRTGRVEAIICACSSMFGKFILTRWLRVIIGARLTRDCLKRMDGFLGGT